MENRLSFLWTYELLLMTGRSLPEVIMVVPEAWENTKPCDEKLLRECLYHGALGWPALFRLLMEM
jgi:glutamate synthase domain-containing protein 1